MVDEEYTIDANDLEDITSPAEDDNFIEAMFLDTPSYLQSEYMAFMIVVLGLMVILPFALAFACALPGIIGCCYLHYRCYECCDCLERIFLCRKNVVPRRVRHLPSPNPHEQKYIGVYILEKVKARVPKALVRDIIAYLG